MAETEKGEGKEATVESLMELAKSKLKSGDFTSMDMLGFRMLSDLEEKGDLGIDDMIKLSMVEKMFKGKADDFSMKDLMMFKMLEGDSRGRKDPEFEALKRRVELKDTFNPILNELRSLKEEMRAKRPSEEWEKFEKRFEKLEDKISDISKGGGSLDNKILGFVEKERERADAALARAEKDRFSVLREGLKMQIDAVKKAIEEIPGKGEASERRKEFREKKAFDTLDKVIDVIDKHAKTEGEKGTTGVSEKELVEKEIELATEEIKGLREEVTKASAQGGGEYERSKRRIKTYGAGKGGK